MPTWKNIVPYLQTSTIKRLHALMKHVDSDPTARVDDESNAVLEWGQSNKALVVSVGPRSTEWDRVWSHDKGCVTEHGVLIMSQDIQHQLNWLRYAKCSGALHSVEVEGVELDFDQITKGVLFDAGETAEYFELSQDIPEVAEESSRFTGVRWPCPKHPGSSLVEVEFSALGLKLDIDELHGCIWFDGGEIPRFEAVSAKLETLGQRFGSVFDRLRGGGYDIFKLTR